MEKFQIVGKSLNKIDGKVKVTGTAEYIDDLVLPKMLAGKVLRSPYAHALIQNIDASKALKLPGVKAVVTLNDSPKVKFNSAGFPPTPGSNLLADQYILADKARYVGDPVAAVAATDANIAQEALSLIKVDYEPLPFVLDFQDAMTAGAPLIQADKDNNIVSHLARSNGDVEAGFADADFIFEDEYETSKVYPATLEPCGASIARFDIDGRLTIWASTQMPHLVRRIVALGMGLPLGKVRLLKPYVGGGFGSRLGSVNELICALLAQKANLPVKLIYTRKESFVATESRHKIQLKLKTGIKKDGTFSARQLTAYLDAGAYTTHSSSFVAPVANWFIGMYKTPNFKYDGYAVYTNTCPAGAFRGYANPQVNFAVESQVEYIAEQLKLDPLELRLKNHPCKGDIWTRTNWPIESCGLEEAITKGAERINWKSKRQNQNKQTGHKKRGVGMAYMLHSTGAKPRLHEISTAIIKLNEDGSANLVYACSDSGQGSATALSQIAAETIGLRIEEIIITQLTDTDVAGFEIGSHASRQVYSGGYAVYQAAQEVRKQIIETAASILRVDPQRLKVENSKVYVRDDPAIEMSVSEVSYYTHFGPEGHQIIGVASLEPPGNPPVYAAQFVEVEVDTETGVVDVLKVVAAHDVGRAINPSLVEGQIQGAIQQGLGYALTENAVYDPESGEMLNPNFTDYKILLAEDMPIVETILVQAQSLSGAYGVKSVGESGLVATAAAVANAVYNAVGVRIKELPLTPEKVLVAIKQNKLIK